MGALLLFLLQNVASGAVAAIGSDGLNAFLNAIGLGSLTSQAYQKQVLNELSTIQNELQQISSLLAETEAALTQISEQIDDDELQNKLIAFTQDCNVILPQFQSYTTLVSGLANADSTMQATIAGELYELLDVVQMDTVASAMLDINDFMMGDAEMIGIIEYQRTMLENTLTNWMQENGGANLATQTPWAGFRDASQVVSEGATFIGNAITSQVLPTFSAALNAQAQGFLLLTTAWQNGPMAATLQIHANNIQNQITAMYELLTLNWYLYSVNQALCTDFVGSPLMTSAETNADQGNLMQYTGQHVWWALNGQPGAVQLFETTGSNQPIVILPDGSNGITWTATPGTSSTDYKSQPTYEPSLAANPVAPILAAVASQVSAFFANAPLMPAPTTAPSVPFANGANWLAPSPNTAPWYEGVGVSYGVSFVYGSVESPIGPMSRTAYTMTLAYAHLTDVPIGGDGVTARNIYRQFEADQMPVLVGSIPDNTTTVYDDQSAVLVMA